MVNIGNLNTNSERRGFSFIVFIAIIGFSLARGIANFYTNYLWFDSVGLESVWVKILLTRTALVGATSLIAFLFIFTNLRLATRATPVMDIFEAFDSEDPLASEKPIIAMNTMKEKPLLSELVFKLPKLTMSIYCIYVSSLT